MSGTTIWFGALPAMLVLAVFAWVVGTARRNVGLVDVAWSLFFLLGALLYMARMHPPGFRAVLVTSLVALWALRLATHLAIRNWNSSEDYRYREIRERNAPGFAWKSLYLVFGLQALLAWAISAPLAGAIASTYPPGALDLVGALVVLAGIAFEAISDAQLARFKADPANAGQVLSGGLWRYTRHPNYFGDFCVWWGFYLIALGAGAWWTIFAPLGMSVLLLRVSGVALLEKDIAGRRPAYHAYVQRTNAFFPGRPRPS